MTCRTCNLSKPNLKDLFQVSFDDDGSKNTLASKLQSISGCIINRDDASPKTICFQCKLILEMSFEFQRMAQMNEQKFSVPDSDAEMFEEEEFLDDHKYKYIEEETETSEAPDLNDSIKETVTILCDDCGKTFHTKSALDLHRKLIHKKTLSSPSPKRDSRPAKYIKIENRTSSLEETKNDNSTSYCTIQILCDDCGKTFHTKSALDLHRKLIHKKN